MSTPAAVVAYPGAVLSWHFTADIKKKRKNYNPALEVCPAGYKKCAAKPCFVQRTQKCCSKKKKSAVKKKVCKITHTQKKTAIFRACNKNVAIMQEKVCNGLTDAAPRAPAPPARNLRVTTPLRCLRTISGAAAGARSPRACHGRAKGQSDASLAPRHCTLFFARPAGARLATGRVASAP